MRNGAERLCRSLLASILVASWLTGLEMGAVSEFWPKQAAAQPGFIVDPWEKELPSSGLSADALVLPGPTLETSSSPGAGPPAADASGASTPGAVDEVSVNVPSLAGRVDAVPSPQDPAAELAPSNERSPRVLIEVTPPWGPPRTLAYWERVQDIVDPWAHAARRPLDVATIGLIVNPWRSNDAVPSNAGRENEYQPPSDAR